MRERTAVKVARFVPGRGGMSNPSSLFNGEYKYLYRAVDSNGNTIDFMLSAKRNKKAAKRFLKKALGSKHNQIPRLHVHRPPRVTLNETPEEFHIPTGLCQKI